MRSISSNRGAILSWAFVSAFSSRRSSDRSSACSIAGSSIRSASRAGGLRLETEIVHDLGRALDRRPACSCTWGGRLVAVAVPGPDHLRDQARYRQNRRRCGLPVTAKRLPERPIDPRTSMRIHGLHRECLSGSKACFDRPCGYYKQEMDRRSRSAVASIPNIPICSTSIMLGRSQVVRQRVLIPSCAGSIPAAPATGIRDIGAGPNRAEYSC